MAGKGVRAGGTMNVCIAVLLCFALLGALDEGSGGRLGVAEAFRQGLSSMGSLCFSMAGIYCIAVTALPGVAEKAGEAPLPFDSSLLPGLLLAPDMGGWASAAALASTPELAVYAGLLVASTLGCLVSFVLPVSLGTLQYQPASNGIYARDCMGDHSFACRTCFGGAYPENCTGYTAEKLVARDGALCHPQPCAALCTARLRPSAWLVWSGSAVAGGPVVLLDDVGPVCTGTVRNAA